MENRPSNSGLSWLGRVLAGAILGAFLGPLYLLDELTLRGVASSALAGAVFTTTLVAFGAILRRSPVLAFLACGLAGSAAGLVWAFMRDGSIAYSSLVGGILGVVIAALELRVFSSSTDAA